MADDSMNPPKKTWNAPLCGMAFGVLMTGVIYILFFYNVQPLTVLLFLPVLWASFIAHTLFGQTAGYENWSAALVANVLLYAAVFQLVASMRVRNILYSILLLLAGCGFSMALYLISSSCAGCGFSV